MCTIDLIIAMLFNHFLKVLHIVNPWTLFVCFLFLRHREGKTQPQPEQGRGKQKAAELPDASARPVLHVLSSPSGCASPQTRTPHSSAPAVTECSDNMGRW